MAIAAFVVSLAAFGMTLTTWILGFIQNRRKIGIKIIGYSAADGDAPKRLHFVHVMFHNQSRVPVSITEIRLKTDKYDDTSNPIGQVYEHNIFRKNGEIVRTWEHQSMGVPINLAGLSSASGVLLFEDDGLALEVISTPLSFRLETTRGPIEIELPPSVYSKVRTIR